jgi:hypothetical protein
VCGQVVAVTAVGEVRIAQGSTEAAEMVCGLFVGGYGAGKRDHHAGASTADVVVVDDVGDIEVVCGAGAGRAVWAAAV